MLENGKCYYRKNIVFKVIDASRIAYTVKGFNTSLKRYYKRGMLSNSSSCICIDNDIYDKIEQHHNTNNRTSWNVEEVNDSTIDLINELIYGL